MRSAVRQFSFFIYFFQAYHCTVPFGYINFTFCLFTVVAERPSCSLDVTSLSNSSAAFKSALITSYSFIRASSHFSRDCLDSDISYSVFRIFSASFLFCSAAALFFSSYFFSFSRADRTDCLSSVVIAMFSG